MATHRKPSKASREQRRLVVEILRLYPDLQRSLYRLPPVHFNRVPFTEGQVEGLRALIASPTPQVSATLGGIHQSPQPAQAAPPIHGLLIAPCAPRNVQGSDVREDTAQCLVLDRLEQLGKMKNEVMFLVSHLNFSHYLNIPSSSSWRSLGFPMPANLDRENRFGDFDLILIHRQYGIVVGEIKSLGSSSDQQNKSHEEFCDDVVKKLPATVKQMEKCLTLAKFLVSDLTPHPLPVRMTLAVPFVKRSQLHDALSRLPENQRQALCDVFVARDSNEAVKLCLCADEFSDSSPELLLQWWEKMKAHLDCFRQKMTRYLYENIVARYCGLATTIAVHCIFSPRLVLRTEGEAVSEAGSRQSLLVLTPEQVSILHSRPTPLTVLTGPPGTGKSLLLVLKGLQWCRQGNDVHVVSTRPGSLAASHMIMRQIESTLGEGRGAGKPQLHTFDFYNTEDDVENAVTTLKSKTQNSALYVIMDEMGISPDSYDRFITGLLGEVPGLHLWAASMSHENLPRSLCLQQESLQLPLRCPRPVQQEVEKGFEFLTDVRRYASFTVPLFCGLGVRRLRHQGPGHVEQWPWQCRQCGRNIAEVLNNLGVGKTQDNVSNMSPATSSRSAIEPLDYRDVLILTRANLYDDESLTACPIGVVAGLRELAIPVKVVRQWQPDDAAWMEDVRLTALALENKVTVTNYGFVRGLERKVVVCMPGCIPQHDNTTGTERLDAQNRLWAMSRCTAQLILVDLPGDINDMCYLRL